MPILSRLTLTAAAAAIALAVPKPGLAETNMLFILDGSNSMWGQVEGVAKIKTAQDVLASLMADLPKDTKVGLMVYGHRSRESCDDIEILSSIGADAPAELVKKIRSIQPTGKTPIANALFGSMIAFSKFEGQNNHVVLISDGIETCGGDVCMAASAIANANIKPRVHVVGFDVGAKERAQLECIPRMGNGKYFSAANAGELKKAIAQVKQVAQAAPQPPKPKKPKKKKGPKEVFRDDFDGDELADHWEVINPNPDAFIVEDGSLLIISGAPGSLSTGKAENIIRLTKPLPKGDWTATMKFKMGYLTGSETAYLAVYKDKDNYIGAFVDSWSYYEAIRGARMRFYGMKLSKGKTKSFQKRIWGGASGVPFTADSPPNPYLLRLKKVGRSYIPAVKMLGVKKKDGTESGWIEFEKFTVLRPRGNLAIGIYQSRKVSGETTANLDWVKIEAPEE